MRNYKKKKKKKKKKEEEEKKKKKKKNVKACYIVLGRFFSMFRNIISLLILIVFSYHQNKDIFTNGSKITIADWFRENMVYFNEPI